MNNTTENKPPFQVPDISNWIIPLRYYRGWTIEFSVKTEKFNSALLCLFNFNSVADLEKAMDRAIQYRETGK